MKTLIFIVATFFAANCYAHNGWVPCLDVPQQPYPKVVVPVQPAQTFTTYPLPRVYYQWTPYYTLQPVTVEHRRCLFFKNYTTHYVPTTQWVYQRFIAQ